MVILEMGTTGDPNSKGYIRTREAQHGSVIRSISSHLFFVFVTCFIYVVNVINLTSQLKKSDMSVDESDFGGHSKCLFLVTKILKEGQTLDSLPGE